LTTKDTKEAKDTKDAILRPLSIAFDAPSARPFVYSGRRRGIFVSFASLVFFVIR
jgi:hypothetical protein